MGNNSLVSGILSIISGVLGVFYGIGFLVMITFMSSFTGMMFDMDPTFPYEFHNFFGIFGLLYGLIGGFFLLLGILGIVGGIYAIKKKYWGLGLAAAIAGTITFFPCGVAAVVLIALGKGEYERPAVASPGIRSQPVS